jgi:hypothetical protein
MSNVFHDAAYELRRSLTGDVPEKTYTEVERNRVFHKEYPQDTFGAYIDRLKEIDNRTL